MMKNEENNKSSDRSESLSKILSDANVSDKSLIQALVALGEATSKISLHLTNYVSHELAGSQNASGDDQLKLDILCDKAVFDCVRESGMYSTVASEETPEETPVGTACTVWAAIRSTARVSSMLIFRSDRSSVSGPATNW